MTEAGLSPRLICKSAYINDLAYFFDLLEYAGNKIAAQSIVFKDGSETEIKSDTIITLTAAERAEVRGIRITFKDGGKGKLIQYDTYHQKTVERKNVVRYSDLTDVRDDSFAFGVGTGPHEMKDLDFFRYLSYIEDRYGVEKEDGHGLFGLDGNVDIEAAKAMAQQYEKSPKWSHIISMDTQDAADTNFNHREAWKNLIRSKAPIIAKAYNISLENLVINCAYHANTDNPHIHLMFYSKDSSEGFVKGGRAGMNRATEKLKSTLVNTIFKNETVEFGKEKSLRRAELKQQMQARLNGLLQSPVSKFLQPLEALSNELEGLAGKRVYDFMPSETKARVDKLVEGLITQNKDLTTIFASYTQAQQKLIGRYVSSPETLEGKTEQFKAAFFHPKKRDLKLYHNMVIGAALELSEIRRAWLRTTEGEIDDYDIADMDLSSVDFAYEDSDAPELRTTEGEIGDYDIAGMDLSSVDFAYEDSDAPELRTVGGGLAAANYLQVKQTEASPIKYLPQKQFAKNLNKMQFRQIASDKEVCKGLKENIREHLNCCLTDTNSFSAAIVRQKLERMRDNPSVQDSGELFTFLYQTSEQLRNEVDNYLGNIYGQLKGKMSASVAGAFVASYKAELFSGGEHNPVHNSIAWYAKCLDENLFNVILRENKEHLKGINTTVVKGLWSNIEDGELLPLLQALKNTPPENAAERQEFTKQIRQLVYSKSGDKDFADDIDRCAQDFKKSFEKFAEPNIALSFEIRLGDYLWQADPSCSYSYIINRFAEEINSHRCESFFKNQLKSEEMRNYRTHMYHDFQRIYQSGGQDQTELLAIFTNAIGADGDFAITRKSMDAILRLLSSPKHDMLAMKTELYENMKKKLCDSKPDLQLDEKEQEEIFNKFFYGEEKNTFFFREMMEEVAKNGIPPPSNIFLLRRLLLDFGRALCGQNDNARRYDGSIASERSFRAKKQFKNVKFPHEQEELHY